MSAFDNLIRICEQAKQLHAVYQQLSEQKDQIEADAHTTEDGDAVRRYLQQFQAIKQQTAKLVEQAQQIEGQISAACDAIDNEMSALRDKAEDQMSDITAYAADWPAEIDAMTEDLNQWLADEGKSAATAANFGAYAIYR